MGGVQIRQPTPEYLERQREYNRRWDAQREALANQGVIYLPPPPRRTNAIGIPLISVNKNPYFND